MFPIASLAFVGGIMTGSFVGLVAHRMPRGSSVVGGRSMCDSCGVQIAAYDNVPVLSWLMLRGRCRSCGATIPVRYLLVELALGAAFAATAVVFHDDPGTLALGLVFVAMLAAITLTDLERRLIPNRILIAGAVAALAIAVATDPSSLPERGITALVAGGSLLLIALAYPRGMGMGDVKLAAVMGLYLGSAVSVALAVAVIAGSVVGIGVMLREGSGARKQAVPFGPFLALGGVVALLAGDQLVNAYLNAFVR
ncbi:MAG TPA: prepilin peptidase [Solirubrobacterales bacterium]|nr:prepilin peptidase [Solirubrobacterales bacterium]